MITQFEMKKIATVNSCFKDSFAIPRQSGLALHAKASIVFEKEFNDPEYLRGIEDFSHLWLIFCFHQLKGGNRSPLVRPPRLGGNRKLGVFASRSPFRPNAIGMSVVKNEGPIDSSPLTLLISNHDLLDKTPILDIKPYIKDYDVQASHWPSELFSKASLQVHFKKDSGQELLSSEDRLLLMEVLSQDPRPAYHQDKRVYKSYFAEMEVSWMVECSQVWVLKIVNS